MTAEQPQAQKQRQQGHRIKGTTAARTGHFHRCSQVKMVPKDEMWEIVKCVLTVSHPSQICSIRCLYKKTNMSTMLHTVTEIFWMNRDACATKRRTKESTSVTLKEIDTAALARKELWKSEQIQDGYLYSWDCGQPSRQSKPRVGAPSRRPPTQTRQSTAGYVRTTQSETQRWRSATYGHPVRHKCAVTTGVA